MIGPSIRSDECDITYWIIQTRNFSFKDALGLKV